MKKMKLLATAIFALLAVSSSKSQVSANADIVSNYVWRGTKFSGLSIQPTINYSNGGFSIGSWGSAGVDGFTEMDLYAKYAFNFGLTLGVNDYYFPGTKYFDISKENGAHGLEANLSYSINKLSLSANYMINQAGGAKTAGGDKYVEISYALGSVSLFAGAGDGWHTPDGKFALVNVGLSTAKSIKISDSFSLPMKVSAILNPKTEQYYLVAGISL